MVSFVIGKEIEKYVFRLVTSVGQRKYSDEKHLSLFFLPSSKLSISLILTLSALLILAVCRTRVIRTS